ncbi:hypothetical protein MKW98_004631, partial [Papaver atlanticum]
LHHHHHEQGRRFCRFGIEFEHKASSVFGLKFVSPIELQVRLVSLGFAVIDLLSMFWKVFGRLQFGDETCPKNNMPMNEMGTMFEKEPVGKI